MTWVTDVVTSVLVFRSFRGCVGPTAAPMIFFFFWMRMSGYVTCFVIVNDLT